MELDRFNVVTGLIAIALAYWSCKTVYNIFFHPLAGFPGPWWATTSYLPEFYYDVLKGGMYHKKVIQMHDKYGRYLPLRAMYITIMC
jgi:hypothetical protein